MLREDAISSRPITSKFLYIHYSPIFLQFDTIRGLTIKFANLILEGFFIMNMYQLDKESKKFTIWKY